MKKVSFLIIFMAGHSTFTYCAEPGKFDWNEFARVALLEMGLRLFQIPEIRENSFKNRIQSVFPQKTDSEVAKYANALETLYQYRCTQSLIFVHNWGDAAQNGTLTPELNAPLEKIITYHNEHNNQNPPETWLAENLWPKNSPQSSQRPSLSL